MKKLKQIAQIIKPIKNNIYSVVARESGNYALISNSECEFSVTTELDIGSYFFDNNIKLNNPQDIYTLEVENYQECDITLENDVIWC